MNGSEILLEFGSLTATMAEISKKSRMSMVTFGRCCDLELAV